MERCCNNGGGVKGLAHIGVHARDMDRAIAFYRDLLGFTLTATDALRSEQGDIKLALLQRGSCTIELIEPPQGADSGSGAVNHIALEVGDIEKVARELKEKGITFETPAIREPAVFGGVRNIFFSGPSGERLELFTKKG